jgi:hypothetical protein
MINEWVPAIRTALKEAGKVKAGTRTGPFRLVAMRQAASPLVALDERTQTP